MKAPEITVKLYIHFNIHLEKVEAVACDMSHLQGWILLGTHDVTIPVLPHTPIDLIDRQIVTQKPAIQRVGRLTGERPGY